MTRIALVTIFFSALVATETAIADTICWPFCIDGKCTVTCIET